jgi:hypothetical protein
VPMVTPAPPLIPLSMPGRYEPGPVCVTVTEPRLLIPARYAAVLPGLKSVVCSTRASTVSVPAVLLHWLAAPPIVALVPGFHAVGLREKSVAHFQTLPLQN